MNIWTNKRNGHGGAERKRLCLWQSWWHTLSMNRVKWGEKQPSLVKPLLALFRFSSSLGSKDAQSWELPALLDPKFCLSEALLAYRFPDKFFSVFWGWEDYIGHIMWWGWQEATAALGTQFQEHNPTDLTFPESKAQSTGNKIVLWSKISSEETRDICEDQNSRRSLIPADLREALLWNGRSPRTAPCFRDSTWRNCVKEAWFSLWTDEAPEFQPPGD